MKRDNFLVWVYCVIVPMVVGVFLAGWQQARAVPVCVECACKEVYRWWSHVQMPNQAMGGKKPDTNQDWKFGLVPIQTTGDCATGPGFNLGRIDLYRFNQCARVCQAVGTPSLIEMTCTDDDPEFVANASRRVCGNVPPPPP